MRSVAEFLRHAFQKNQQAMGAWTLYFLVKLALYYKGIIGLHWLANMGLAVALAWPLSSRQWRRRRLALALPVALALLYWDSHLDSWAGVLHEAGALGDFRLDYLVELGQRLVSVKWLVAFAVLATLYWLVSRGVRLVVWVFVGLVVAAILPAPTAPPAPQLDAALAAYLAQEHGKTVSFARAGPAQFDLILLSVCSLSNDDLALLHMQDDPFLKRFDVVFHRFNSVTTYSGPAVLRLLRGTCGQTTQAELVHGGVADECYLFHNLAAAGYHPAILLNHDGQFAHFAEQLRKEGGADAAPLDNRMGPVTMTSFDGAPVRDDFGLLDQWWHQHEKDAFHNVLLYNTITLHDGTLAHGASGSSLDTYAFRLRQLFSELGRLLDEIEVSGRPTVVVLIPEHGAALRGDAIQVSGMRVLPTPDITTVPVAVKLIGFGFLGRDGKPLVVEQPTSYLSLMTLIVDLARAGPGNVTPESLQGLLPALPAVQWVAENQNTVFFRSGERAYLRAPDGKWTEFEGLPSR